MGAIETKVGALDGDVKQINTRITSLETKFDNVADGLAHEFRAGLAQMAKQFSERGSTNWAVIFAGFGVVLSVLGFIGNQALAPVWSQVNELKSVVVPRTELEYGRATNMRRFDQLEERIDKMRDVRDKEQTAELDRSRRENERVHADLRRSEIELLKR